MKAALAASKPAEPIGIAATPWFFYKTIEEWPIYEWIIAGLPIENGDFPWLLNVDMI